MLGVGQLGSEICGGRLSSSEVRPRRQVNEGLRGFVLDDVVLQLDVPLEGSLSRVELVALFMRAPVLIVQLALVPALHLPSPFFLTLLHLPELFKQLEHDFLFFLGLLDLLLDELFLFGQEEKFSGVMGDGGQEYGGWWQGGSLCLCGWVLHRL